MPLHSSQGQSAAISKGALHPAICSQVIFSLTLMLLSAYLHCRLEKPVKACPYDRQAAFFKKTFPTPLAVRPQADYRLRLSLAAA